MKWKSKYAEIKPEFGNREQISLVRKYDEILRGLKPVKILYSWAGDKSCELEYALNYRSIECPCCGIRHKIVWDTEYNCFEFDSQFCDLCETEFMFNPENEFEILVKQE